MGNVKGTDHCYIGNYLIIHHSQFSSIISRWFNPISTGGGCFPPEPSKWLRTPQRNKLAPRNLVTFQNWVLAKFSIL